MNVHNFIYLYLSVALVLSYSELLSILYNDTNPR